MKESKDITSLFSNGLIKMNYCSWVHYDQS